MYFALWLFRTLHFYPAQFNPAPSVTAPGASAPNVVEGKERKKEKKESLVLKRQVWNYMVLDRAMQKHGSEKPQCGKSQCGNVALHNSG